MDDSTATTRFQIMQNSISIFQDAEKRAVYDFGYGYNRLGSRAHEADGYAFPTYGSHMYGPNMRDTTEDFARRTW